MSVRKILKCSGIFIAAACILTIILVASTRIPREVIRENTLSSAEYLCEGELFGYVWDQVAASRIDRYADSILLGIAWQTGGEHPLRDVMMSSYYHEPLLNENDNLLKAVSGDLSANQQYLRYWHGSVAVVRPLLAVMSVKGMYILSGVLIFVLGGVLIALLSVRGTPSLFWGVIAGLAMSAVWFVPFSLEYGWCYLVTLGISIAAILMMPGSDYCVLFLLSGIITNYLDFLTAETLTLTVPLLIILWFEGSKSSVRRGPFRTAASGVISWGAGYAGMWLLKWGLASLVLGENAMPYVAEHIEERLVGDAGIAGSNYPWSAAGRNLADLLPFGLGGAGAFAGVLLIVGCVYLSYVYRRKGADMRRIAVYAAVGCIPFVRFFVLNNHSYLHHFFTFRALMGTVLAVSLIIGELIGRRGRAGSG